MIASSGPGFAQDARGGRPEDPRDPVPAHGLQLPATFRGDLPCADCEGVRHHLDV